MLPHLLARLRRITSGSSWIPEIDGLRFVAIASVVLYHLSAELYSRGAQSFHVARWYAPFMAFLGQGHKGVLLFFVISGFILGRPFARQYLLGEGHISLRRYYLRRLTRLEPPYLLNLVLLALALALYAHERWSMLLPHLLASAVYLHHPTFGTDSTINPVAWTLEVEVQFYLLVPVLTLIFRVRPAALRRLLLLAGILGTGLSQQHFFWGRPVAMWVWGSILLFVQYFLAGLLFSDLYVLGSLHWSTSWVWDVAAAVAWPVVFLGIPFWLYPIHPLLILLCYLGAFRGVLFRHLFRTSWIAIIGGMCYSMYLWHFFVIALVFKATRHLVVFHDVLLDLLVQCAVVLPCVLLVTVVYFAYVERPCMDPAWPQKLKAALGSRPKRLPVA